MRWLQQEKYLSKWDRVQWHWIREATADRTLEASIELLSSRFVVGLTSRFDETLLIWRTKLSLKIRDVLYTSVKAQLSHPKITDWSDEARRTAEKVVEDTGDLKFFEVCRLATKPLTITPTVGCSRTISKASRGIPWWCHWFGKRSSSLLHPLQSSS